MIDIVSILVLLGIMVLVQWTMVRVMGALEGAEIRFLPAAWLTTLWGEVSFLSLAAFCLHLVQLLGA